MAETQQKRLREDSLNSETPEFDESNSPNSKRQKPYNNILSLLDEEVEEDEEPTTDLSAIFTTLEQEISSTTTAAAYDVDFPAFAAAVEEEDINQQNDAVCSSSSGDCADEDDGVKSVMRHLLEASDDELGIPNTDDSNGGGEINYDNGVEINFDENFPLGFSDHGIWELEDVAANYYTMLQSELFM